MKKKPFHQIERNQKIVALYDSGPDITFRALSNMYGVSEARIRQIYYKEKSKTSFKQS